MIAAAVCIFAALAASGFPAKQNPNLQQQRNLSAVQIVLPPQLETGKPATLAILDGEGRLLAGVNVGLSDGRQITTDATGRARFVVTSAPGKFEVHVYAGADSVANPAGAAEVISGSSTSPTEVAISQVPRFTELGGRIDVRGTGFRGDADMNEVFISGQPSLVLAASPASLVIVAGPNEVPGAAALEVEAGGRRSKPAALTFVSIAVEPQAIPIVEGKRNHLVVSVRGTEEKLLLAVENRTPDVIALTGGNIQRVRSSGGIRNQAVIQMRALQSKEFSVSVKLAPEAR